MVSRESERIFLEHLDGVADELVKATRMPNKMLAHNKRHLIALYVDNDLPDASPFRTMAMLLLLICAIGVVSFMVFALAYYGLLRGNNPISQEYVDYLEAKRAVLTSEIRLLLATLPKSEPQQQNARNVEDASGELQRSAEDFRRLANEYTDTLKALVALRQRVRTRSPDGDGGGENPGYLELERLHLEHQTLSSELRDLERDARFGSSGETRAIHAEIRKNGCLTYPEKETVSCRGFGSLLLERAFREHIDLVVLWIRPGAVEPYYSIDETIREAGIRVSHEPLPIGESVEAILAGLRYD